MTIYGTNISLHAKIMPGIIKKSVPNPTIRAVRKLARTTFQ